MTLFAPTAYASIAVMYSHCDLPVSHTRGDRFGSFEEFDVYGVFMLLHFFLIKLQLIGLLGMAVIV